MSSPTRAVAVAALDGEDDVSVTASWFFPLDQDPEEAWICRRRLRLSRAHAERTWADIAALLATEQQRQRKP